MSEVSPCIQRLKSSKFVVTGYIYDKKGNFQSHSLFFVPCLYIREGHCGPDWRPWRAGSGPQFGDPWTRLPFYLYAEFADDERLSWTLEKQKECQISLKQ